MIIGSFETSEPVPQLHAPHAFAWLKPWVDCGSVGTLALQRLETRFGSRELAKLAQPGNFYDFTRYRPVTYYQSGVRQLTIPNTVINWARGDIDHDFVFLHLLEPHILGDVFATSVWQVLKTLGIQRYCLLGSFYDLVPHTRPLLISGGSSNRLTQAGLASAGVRQSKYEGPTSICNLISQEAEKAGAETLTLLVHLPQYTELEEDYNGMVALLRVLHSLYDIPVSDTDIRLAEGQTKILEAALEKDENLKTLITQLESDYDSRLESSHVEEGPQLSPEVNNFLKEMENRFRES